MKIQLGVIQNNASQQYANIDLKKSHGSTLSATIKGKKSANEAQDLLQYLKVQFPNFHTLLKAKVCASHNSFSYI